MERIRSNNAVDYEKILGDSNKRYVGYFCSYVPEEIFQAAGLIPVRLFSRPSHISRADAHLQSNVCSLARSCLELALSETGKKFTAFAFAHTCDTVQCLADIFEVNLTEKSVFNLIGPVNREAKGAKEFLVRELDLLVKQLEESLGIKRTEEDLQISIQTYNKLRALLVDFNVRRGEWSALEFYQVLQRVMLSPKEEAIKLLEEKLVCKAADDKTVSSAKSKIAKDEEGSGVYLQGALLYDLTLVQKIEEAGGRVVGDSLCNGTRYFATPEVTIKSGEGALEALAERYLKRLPCAAKHPDIAENEAYMLEEVTRTGAKGVIFINDLFCEPHNWDLVPLGKTLKKAGVPHLTLQMDQMGVTEQIVTRLQAFMEQLKEGAI